MAAIFADDIFKWISMNEKFCISNRISLKLVPGSGNGLPYNMRQAITWTNAGPVHRRIYAAVGWDDLTNISYNT